MSGNVKRGRGVSEAMHREHLKAVERERAKREKQQADEDVKVEAKFVEAKALGLDTTPAAIRLALAEQAAADTRRDRARRVNAARVLVGADEGAEGRSVEDVRRWGEALRGPDGTRPTQEVVAWRMGCSVRWVSDLCRPYGGYRAVVPNRKS